MSLDPRAVEADLAAYYDGEEGRESRPMDPRRLTARAAVIESLSPASRVLEIGSGPGRPGGRAVIGVWGGRDIEEHSDEDEATGRPPRLFARRSDERWRTMLGRIGAVDTFEAWDDGDDFTYQWAVVRRSAT